MSDMLIRKFNNGVLVSEETVSTPVPPSVSPLQARKALKAAGLLASVRAMIENLPEDDDARIAWEYATEWQRNSQWIASMGTALSLTTQQIDDLFISASQL